MSLTSNFLAIKAIIILFITRSLEDFSQERLSNVARQSILRFTSTLIASSPKSPSIQRFTLKTTIALIIINNINFCLPLLCQIYIAQCLQIYSAPYFPHPVDIDLCLSFQNPFLAPRRQCI